MSAIGRNAPTPLRRPPPVVVSSGTTMEELIEAAVERAVLRVIGSLLERPNTPAPIVYTVAQAADALQVSQDTISRMVRRGALPRVPQVGGKVLIPRHALDRLVASAEELGQAGAA